MSCKKYMICYIDDRIHLCCMDVSYNKKMAAFIYEENGEVRIANIINKIYIDNEENIYNLINNVSKRRRKDDWCREFGHLIKLNFYGMTRKQDMRQKKPTFHYNYNETLYKCHKKLFCKDYLAFHKKYKHIINKYTHNIDKYKDTVKNNSRVIRLKEILEAFDAE